MRSTTATQQQNPDPENLWPSLDWSVSEPGYWLEWLANPYVAEGAEMIRRRLPHLTEWEAVREYLKVA